MIKSTFSTFNPWIFFDGTMYKMGLDEKNFHLLIFTIFVLIFFDWLKEKGYHLREIIAQQHFIFRWILYLVGIFSIIIFVIYGIDYNAAEFIYKGF